MKKILLSILSAFMVSTMASAQYLNVKLKDGTYSFKTSSDMEVSFGDKKGTEPTEFEQTVTVGDYKVTVKLADGTPASDVALHAFIEGDKVKIEAMCWDGYRLECIKDNEVLATVVDNGFHTFTVSDISKDMVVTIGYITVSFDLNNSDITDNFKAKPEDITKMYNSTIAPTYASAEKHSFRGWYTDKECTEAWNYSTVVTKSMTLYAKWAEDPTGTQINGHNFVKLGGYYWATENVGHVIGDHGYMYMFQDTYGCYYNQANAIEAAKTWNSGSGGGRTWTLPSKAQWQALCDYCEWVWITDEKSGMEGMLVRGRKDTYDSGNSIFLPAVGRYYPGFLFVDDPGNSADYWSADSGSYLYFNSGRWWTKDGGNEGWGYGVRPVSE
ncbi:MAG: InlB B-repeat-containing protein [Bacteroidales bacterium]|nr:InlB B-repeat-containing protein [Bacteroidales bacterium]